MRRRDLRALPPGPLPGLLLGLLLAGGCGPGQPQSPSAQKGRGTVDARSDERTTMVREQLEPRGITDPAVLAAMRKVPRHLFVPADQRTHAYEDRPLPIGHDQTISQPYIVALMSELARIGPGSRVLEVGTGSGYQAAVLAELGARVHSIEIVEALAKQARSDLSAAGYTGYSQVALKHGDGYAGWPEHAPFDAILLTAAPPRIPEPLKQQLAIGGRLILPLGRGIQDLIVLTRTTTGFTRESITPVRFVPMTGQVQQPE